MHQLAYNDILLSLISQDAFLEWETNEDPEEQEGKGVALKSCTQFFEWLKTAETEDDDEEKQRQVSILYYTGQKA